MTSYTYRISGISLGNFNTSYYITGISSNKIPNNGGYCLYLTGKFPVGEPMLFFIGSTGSTSDTECWSGKVDQGNVIYSMAENMVRVWSPRLPLGGPYHVSGYIPSMKLDLILPYAISTIPKAYTSCTFEIRGLFPNVYRTGPRRIDLVPPI